jgi:hypothetical protein
LAGTFRPHRSRKSAIGVASTGAIQELADEAFADLLVKHHRPRTLKEALKQSARRAPAKENRAPKRR